MGDQPLLPDYGGACVTNIVPALLDARDHAPDWLPDEAIADQTVLLVLDGLGWEQLTARAALAPTLTSMRGGPIVTVAPSTTATALTSIATGMTPGEHGVVGYRMSIDGEVLNVLRWQVAGRDARAAIPPDKIQVNEPFLGHRPSIVTRAEFRNTGFTQAHLEGVRFNGYRMPSTLVAETTRLLRGGEPFVYAYYDGIDKVAHEYGLSEQYDAELVAVEELVSYLLEALPRGASLVVTSDHGQVDVGEDLITLGPDLVSHVSHQSGEGRFRWLHARPGRASALLEAAQVHADRGWVVSQEQVIDDGWFGPTITDPARSRLGDVALVAREDVAYVDADDTGPFHLIARHGSVTPAEMRVPLLARRP